MRILAIESSLTGGSVAALEDSSVAAERLLEPGKRTAQTLTPAIHALLEQVAWKPRDVELVAVTQGPGSFTGLRIGVTTAKTFAYATGASILGVNTLEVLADRVPTSRPQLWAVMDAERQQLFAASFEVATGQWTESTPTQILDVESWLAMLRADAYVVGPPLQRLAASLALAPVAVAPVAVAEEWWFPRAASVGRVAWRHFQSGRRDDVWKLLPQYFRESAAVEKARSHGTHDTSP